MDDHSAANAMAAAIAAAAELAKNGGMTLFDEGPKKIGEDTTSLHQSSPLNENSSSNEKVLSSEDKSDSYSSGAMLDTEFDEDMDGEEDAEKRLARSRERNREHARRTRLRKKAQLEGLQTKVKGLEAEGKLLRQSIEECSIASILVGLSSGDETKSVTDSLLSASDLDSMAKPKVSVIVGGKRKRFISDDNMEKPPQPLKLNIDGQITLIGGGKTHINWKSGVYCDDNGSQRKLTQDQLESLRRERNRMHAKMTRDRKRNFIAAIEKSIDQLESDNKKMREVLTKVAKHHFGPNAVTPHPSPLIQPLPPPTIQLDDICRDGHSTPEIQDEIAKPHHNRVPHGFSLTAP